MTQVNGSMLQTIKTDTFLDWDSNVTAESDGQMSIYMQPPSAPNNGSNDPFTAASKFQVGGWWGLSLAKMLVSLFKATYEKFHEPNRLMVLDAVREGKDIPRVMADHRQRHEPHPPRTKPHRHSWDGRLSRSLCCCAVAVVHLARRARRAQCSVIFFDCLGQPCTERFAGSALEVEHTTVPVLWLGRLDERRDEGL